MAISTIGHGGRKFVDFISLLQEHGITFVADVRRFPGSTVLEYNKENLEAKLARFGIRYLSMGDTLGGFRKGGYRKHMVSDSYPSGINELLKLAGGANVVLM